MLPSNWVNVVNDILCCATGDFKKSIEQLAAIIEAHGYLPRPTYPPLQRVWASIPSLEIEAMWPIEQEAPFAGDDQRHAAARGGHADHQRVG